jgi:hypothetical protein
MDLLAGSSPECPGAISTKYLTPHTATTLPEISRNPHFLLELLSRAANFSYVRQLFSVARFQRRRPANTCRSALEASEVSWWQNN